MTEPPLPPLDPSNGKITHDNTHDKTYYTTTNPIEIQFGYHRAVRRGNMIWVSGTTALKLASEQAESIDGGGSARASNEDKETEDEKLDRQSTVHHRRDAKAQAVIAMERCVEAVRRLGGSRADIVRVKMFVARHEDCGDVGEAYRQCFSETSMGSGVGAAATMIVVRDGFVDLDMLVEVEIDAMIVD